MRIRHGREQYDVTLGDDGTMDTVVIINGHGFMDHEARFDAEYASEYRREDGSMTRAGLRALALDAIMDGPPRPEPGEDAYIISDTGPLGSVAHMTAVTQYGRVLGKFTADAPVFRFIARHMDTARYWPDVYRVNDHGNLTLYSMSRDKRGRLRVRVVSEWV